MLAGATAFSAAAAPFVHAQATAKRHVALSHSVSYASDPSMYCDILEPAGGASLQPVMLIHGGAHTGSCYMRTADGRPGWAYVLAQLGHKVIVPDWPGIGRSGYIAPDQLTGELVVRALSRVLLEQVAPATVVTHSMSGPFGWKLLERHGDRIASLVALAPGGPGNIAPKIEFLSDNDEEVEVRLAPNAPALKLSKKRPFVAPRGWAINKLVGGGSRFPKGNIDDYLSTLIPIPQRLLLERVNYQGSAPKVADFRHFSGKRVALVIGTHDPDHPPEVDIPIVEWLKANGAAAEFVDLGARGVRGNGHMLMMEQNSDELALALAQWIRTGAFAYG